jgi:hypothetical protein
LYSLNFASLLRFEIVLFWYISPGGITRGRGKFAISPTALQNILCTWLAVAIRISLFGESLKYLITNMIIIFVGKPTKKRRRIVPPMWWRWSRRSFLFHMLNGHLRVKQKRLRWAEFWSTGIPSNCQHAVYSTFIPDYIFWLTL